MLNLNNDLISRSNIKSNILSGKISYPNIAGHSNLNHQQALASSMFKVPYPHGLGHAAPHPPYLLMTSQIHPNFHSMDRLPSQGSFYNQ